MRCAIVKLFQCVVISSVKLFDATSRAYWDLDLSRMYWHWGMNDADDWRLRSRDCASSRVIFSTPPAPDWPVYSVSHRDSTWAS